MAAGWFSVLAGSTRARSTERSHSNLPVSRAKHCVKSLPFSKAVVKTCRRVRTGEDLPARKGVLQTRFLLLLNSVGKPESLETPEPFGPRKRVHSWALAVQTNSRNANKNRGQFITVSYDTPE